MSTADYEKLGVFYLGRTGRPGDAPASRQLLLYDSRDLTTHAVCVGMTGSGKTGLCIGLLEEAVIDGIPALVIDPKGDLTNLLLTFPRLRPEDLAPFVPEDEAKRAGVSREEYARTVAETWRKGLAAWDEDGARIQRLRDAAEFQVYTPGGTAGTPVSALRSFGPPPEAVAGDAELLRQRVATTASSLLGLIGVEADPVKSREHVLVSSLLARAWSAGKSLDLPALVEQIQSPPMTKVGVLDLESFYPAKERFALVVALNNLLAGPGFAAWSAGAPLDVDAFLHAPSGKPRVSIFTLSHLGDDERMFFVSLLLNEVLVWMRSQKGTSAAPPHPGTGRRAALRCGARLASGRLDALSRAPPPRRGPHRLRRCQAQAQRHRRRRLLRALLRRRARARLEQGYPDGAHPGRPVARAARRGGVW